MKERRWFIQWVSVSPKFVTLQLARPQKNGRVSRHSGPANGKLVLKWYVMAGRWVHDFNLQLAEVHSVPLKQMGERAQALAAAGITDLFER